MSNDGLVILGNQLFPKNYLRRFKQSHVFMAEDYELCTYYKHHKHKIILFLAAMRNYSDELKSSGFNVEYCNLEDQPKESSYFKNLKEFVLKNKINKLVFFEVEDKSFEEKINNFVNENSLEFEVLESPMFLCSRQEFKKYLGNKKRPFMKTFYEKERKRLEILLDDTSGPVGGKWSYDSDNRKKLPKNEVLPNWSVPPSENANLNDVTKLVDGLFPEHPGVVENFFWPTTRKEYLNQVIQFCNERLRLYGKYQDAITQRDPFVYHALISPGLNLGLITPEEVMGTVLDYFYDLQGTDSEVPLSSVEGFVRQLMGWREFIRGIYQNFSDVQESRNYWGHKRKMNSCWYSGETGIDPLDDSIQRAGAHAYSHHIERLMILSNTMLMCELDPKEVHRWFMEMYVDSSDWVMGPNVYGMGQFSDGGIFATKPYISGSNYILKMSDYKKGPWCDIMDGLYWRFVDKHKDFFSKNPRMKMMMGALDRMQTEKRERIFTAANQFINRVTFE